MNDEKINPCIEIQKVHRRYRNAVAARKWAQAERFAADYRYLLPKTFAYNERDEQARRDPLAKAVEAA
jgi:hypothetical protein